MYVVFKASWPLGFSLIALLDTRILLTLLLDENARPTPRDMKLWVDVVRYIKRDAKGGALSFFTYMELSVYQMVPVDHMLMFNFLNRYLDPHVPYYQARPLALVSELVIARVFLSLINPPS